MIGVDNSKRVNPARYVQETLKGAFPHDVPLEKGFVASLFTACFDESGTHTSSPATIVAGFIANTTEWTAFAEDWEKALNEFGIDVFHMNEFESYIGPFAEWSKEKHQECINCLLNIINAHVFWSVGCMVPQRSFDSLLTKKAQQKCGDIYGLAAIACFRSVAERIKDPKLDGWLDCIMEFGATGAGTLQQLVAEESKNPEWLAENRILGLSFRDKHAFTPLQAADILAYELYKHADRIYGEEKRKERYPLLQLGQRPYKQWHCIDDDELRRVNEWLDSLS